MDNTRLATTDRMKAEAINRMRLMGLREDYVERFDNGYEIMVFRRDPGSVELITEDEDALIDKFERKNHALVWALLCERDEERGMDWYTLLFVSGNPDAWEEERKRLYEPEAFLTGIHDAPDILGPYEGDGFVYEDEGQITRVRIAVADGKLQPAPLPEVTFRHTFLEDGDEFEDCEFDSIRMSVLDDGTLEIQRAFTEVGDGHLIMERVSSIPYGQLERALGTDSPESTAEAIGERFLSAHIRMPRNGLSAFRLLIPFLEHNGIPYRSEHFENPVCGDGESDGTEDL